MANNLKLDSNHDILIGRGATRVEGAAQVAQLTKCRLLTILNEWKLDTSLGIDWFGSVAERKVTASDIQTACAKIIRETNGVLALLNLTIDLNRTTREATISFSAVSVYGDISEVASWQS